MDYFQQNLQTMMSQQKKNDICPFWAPNNSCSLFRGCASGMAPLDPDIRLTTSLSKQLHRYRAHSHSQNAGHILLLIIRDK